MASPRTTLEGSMPSIGASSDSWTICHLATSPRPRVDRLRQPASPARRCSTAVDATGTGTARGRPGIGKTLTALQWARFGRRFGPHVGLRVLRARRGDPPRPPPDPRNRGPPDSIRPRCSGSAPGAEADDGSGNAARARRPPPCPSTMPSSPSTPMPAQLHLYRASTQWSDSPGSAGDGPKPRPGRRARRRLPTEGAGRRRPDTPTNKSCERPKH